MGSTARISDNDFQRLSAAEMWKRVDAQAAQLSDEALDIELGRSGINAPLDKLDRTAKIRLFVGTPPKEKPFAKPSRAHKLLERRKRWVEEWQSWDDARLVKRLRKFGIDGEGCRKDALINQLLQVETERFGKPLCTSYVLHVLGISFVAAMILGTFLGISIWLAVES